MKSDMLEKLAKEIFKYMAYPKNYQVDDVTKNPERFITMAA